MSDARIEESYELSPMQQGMLFDALAGGEPGADVEQVICSLDEAVEVESLVRAWVRVVQRHPVLRTAFRIQDEGQPLQDVFTRVDVPVERLDWRVVPPPELEENWSALLQADRQRGFDLLKPPLMRLLLVAFRDDHYRLLWTFHHAVLDGRAFPLVLREAFAIYDAGRRGISLDLPPAPPYRDHICWLRGLDMSRTEQFWRDTLRGFSAATAIGVPRATDVDGDRTRGMGGLEERLPLATTTRLTTFAREGGITLSTLVQGAWALLLHRYSAEPEVVFGVTRTLRRSGLEGAEDMIGLLFNTLPARVPTDPGVRLLPWLQALRKGQLDARGHEHAPLARVQAWSDVPAGTPLFNTIVIFDHRTLDTALRSLGGNWTNRRAEIARQTRFPLTLLAYGEPELLLRLEHHRGVVDDHAARQMLGHLRRLLEAMPEHADRPIGSLQLTTETERTALGGWNATSSEYSEACVHELVAAQAGRTPERVAVGFEGSSLRYGELEEKSERLARRLRHLGVSPGVRAGVYMERSPEMLIGVLGILKAGGAYVPLDPAFPPERLAYMLEDSKAVVLLTHAAVVDEVPSRTVPVVRIEEEGGAQADLREVRACPDDLAYVIYTSGSTGRPKGVGVTHRSLVNLLESMGREPGLRETDVLLSVTTLSFDIAALELYLPLLKGARVELASREETLDGRRLVERLTSSGATVMQATPATWRMLLESGWEGTRELKVLCGGEALARDLADELLKRTGEVWNVYGPTETTVWSSAERVASEKGPISIGQPIANTQMWVLSGYLEPQPVGVPGELYIGGVGVARGYWERPELTAERFVPDPFSPEPGSRLYRTGDVARWLEDGRLECLGRIDHQVKVRGFRIELGEIEAALRECPGVEQAVVLAQDAESGDRRLVAYLVPGAAGAPQLAGLRTQLGARLPHYMLPSSFAWLDSLPLTPNGKVDRKALARMDAGPGVPRTAHVAPRTPTEEVLAGIWAEVLRLERVGVEENFFELGGHSLLAMQVVSRVRKALDVELPLRELFAAPTVKGLAARVEDLRPTTPSVLVAPPLRTEGREAPEEVSFAQQRLWFLDQLEVGSATYVIRKALRLRGSLHVGALESALSAIVARHESLRTTFARLDGRLVQVVSEPDLRPLPIVDLTAKPERFSSVVNEEARRGYDLGAGPLFRACLYRLAPDEHVLLLSVHHIVADGWSLDVLLSELAECYGSFVGGRQPSLPPLPVRYRDFSVWQREWLRGETLARQLEFWRSRLDGAPQVLNLPTDRPRPAVETHRGAILDFVVPREVSEQIAALARREGVTLFTVLLAAFDVLLWRCTGQEDLLVATPVAGRSRVEVEGLIGLFVNTLVLRGEMSGNPTVRELLARVWETCLGAYAHQDLPFEMLVEELRPERDLSRNPLFQVMLVLQNTSAERPQLPGLAVTPAELSRDTSQFDLTLELEQAAEGLRGRFEYATDLFDPNTVGSFQRSFEMILRAFVHDHSRSIADLPLLDEEERRRVLVEWSGAGVAGDATPPVLVHQAFERQAEHDPAATALIWEGGSLTYQELNRRANRLAHFLKARGVGPETRVGVCLPRSPELIVALLGVLKAGGAYVPLEHNSPPARLAALLDDAGTPLVLTGSGFRAIADGTRSIPVCLDELSEALDKEADTNPPGHARPENVAYVIYTSGSTGRPKGVLVEHGSLAAYVDAVARELRVVAEDRVLQFASIAFDVSAEEIYTPLARGATLLLRTETMSQSIDDFVSRCRDWGVTILDLPSAFWHELVTTLATGAVTLPPTVRLVFVGGERVLPERVAQWSQAVPTGVRLLNGYGPTEATIAATWCDLVLDGKVVEGTPIGRPVPGWRAYVLDPQGHPVAPGMIGELYLGGRGVARGYLGRPELTAEVFLPDPFEDSPGSRLYRTGDLVHHLPDGSLAFVGRVGQQVKIRGFRVELEEIEHVLRSHPAVQDAVVTAPAFASGVRTLVAYVVPSSGPVPPSSDLRGFLGERLPEYMVPATFVGLERLPLNQSGKVDRRALPAPTVLVEPSREYQSPRTRAEEILTRIWSEVLQVSVVGIRDDFFELGGDSILSLQVMARASAAGLRFRLQDLFEHHTVAELAQRVELTEGANGERAEQGPVSGPVPLTPIQRWFLGESWEEPHHFNQSMMLVLGRDVPPEILEEAVTLLELHHDALRMRFSREEHGWEQVCTPPTGESPFQVVDLTVVAEEARPATIERMADRTQRSLDLARGPVWRVVLFREGKERPSRMLVVIHHLVVDGVSWRVLLEDLQTVCGQLLRGEQASLPAKTTSFKRWSERLAAHAREKGSAAELRYWQEEVRRESPALPVDRVAAASENTVGTVRTVSVELDVEHTRALLQDVPAAYRTQIQDVLLTAVLEAFRAWTGRDELLLELEGHGREHLFEGVDLSRTVGWFTTVFPVRLRRAAGGPGEALMGVKEQLRRVPNRGIGHGILRYMCGEDLSYGAQVSFNYLGQFDQVFRHDGLLQTSRESRGPDWSERGQRTLLLELNGRIAGGRLRMDFSYSEAVHERATVEALSRGFERSLLELIAHCQSGAWGLTPSDFPLAGLDQENLERVLRGRREVEDIYPLSPTQEGMLLHTLMSPRTGQYFDQAQYDLEGPLETAAFRKAWERTVERHAVLRTRFCWEELERPLQVVERGVSLPWDEEDWRALEPVEQGRRLEALLKADRERGFDLDRSPLMRMRLLRLGDRAYRLLWSSHHLLLDGWSGPLVWKEVLAHYRSLVSGEEVKLAEERPYRDYIAWLQERDLEAAEVYWRKGLEGFSEPTPLGAGRPARVDETPSHFEERAFALSEAVTAELKAVGRRHGVTQNTLAQGAWAMLLSRYSREDDVVFGVTTSGRPPSLRGVETMIGLFISTLPLRVRLGHDQTAIDWLKALQRRQAEQAPYEHTPLAMVQKWAGVQSGRALFESVLVFENYPIVPSTAAPSVDLTVKSLGMLERTNYPLLVQIMPEARLRVRVVYDRARFEPETIQRIEEHLTRLLEGLATDPARRLGEVSLLGEDERQRLVREFNGTAVAYPLEKTIPDLWREQVQRSPETVAVSCDGRSLSYRQLDQRSSDLANRLKSLGVGPEVLVGVCAERSLEMVEALLAVLKAGGAYVPLDPSYPRERLAFMLEDAATPVVLAQPHLLDRLPERGARVLLLDGREEQTPLDDSAPTGGAGPDNLAYVIFTSGSTGRPKGAMNAHRGVVNRLLWMQQQYELGPSDVVLQKTPFSFDVSVWEFFWPLLTGARLEVARPEGHKDPTYLVSLINAEGITTMHFVPSMLSVFLEEDGVETCQSLRRVICSGEALSHELQERFFARLPAVELHNLYGPTEAAVDVTYWACQPGDGRRSVPIGRPVANTQIHVLDRGLDPVPVGVAGELFIGGVQVGRGYYDRAELTAERFVPDPFAETPGSRLYRTGDLAQRLDDGSIEYLGRMDHQVKIRGFRIELGEIEAAMAEDPAVREAVAIVREDRTDDKRLVGYYVASEGVADPGNTMRARLRTRLPEYMVPSVLVRLEALPLLSSGKLDRRGLPPPDPTGQGAPGGHQAPRTDLERMLVDVWAKVLGGVSVGVEDNFFDAGGNSLLAIRVLAQVRRLGFDIAILTLFRYPTVRLLADHLGGGQTATPDHRGARDRARRQREALESRRSSWRR